MAKKILLVEDDEEALRLISSVLTRQGYEVAQANSIQRATDLWTEPGNKFDLLLTDVRLEEDDDGFIMAEKLLAQHPGVPVIFISGDKDCFASPGIRTFGDAPFLAKPFDVKQMLSAIAQILEKNGQK